MVEGPTEREGKREREEGRRGTVETTDMRRSETGTEECVREKGCVGEKECV